MPVELELAEFALVASAPVEVAEAGTTAGVFDGDDFAPLPPLSDFASPDFAEEPGAVTGGGVQAGASSGIDGAVGVAGRGSSARRFPAAPARKARASPLMSASGARGTLAPSICRRGRSPSQSVLRNQTRCETLRGQAGSRSSVTRGEDDRDFAAGRDSTKARARIGSSEKSARNQECRLERRGKDVERGVQILAPAKSVKTARCGKHHPRGHQLCAKQCLFKLFERRFAIRTHNHRARRLAAAASTSGRG